MLKEMGKNSNYYANLFIFIVLVTGVILLNVQCHRLNDLNINVYTSSQDGDRLTHKSNIRFTSEKESSVPEIKVDENVHFQQINGFGATFNEAGMICLNALSPEAVS